MLPSRSSTKIRSTGCTYSSVDEKKTAEAIDDDGWFHTGDVAEIDPSGRFKISTLDLFSQRESETVSNTLTSVAPS